MTNKDLQNIKAGRLSEPEKILRKIFRNLDIVNYLYVSFYKCNNENIFYFNTTNGYLGYSYEFISSKIRQYFKYQLNDEKEFIIKIVNQISELNVKTAIVCNHNDLISHEKYMKRNLENKLNNDK